MTTGYEFCVHGKNNANALKAIIIIIIIIITIITISSTIFSFSSFFFLLFFFRSYLHFNLQNTKTTMHEPQLHPQPFTFL